MAAPPTGTLSPPCDRFARHSVRGLCRRLRAIPMLTNAQLIAEHVRGWAWFGYMVQR